MSPTGILVCCTVPSEAAPFVYLASVCRSLQCLISALQGGTGAAFPVHTAQAPGCSIWSGPCARRGSSPRVFHKSADSTVPAFCAFPARAAQAARSLTGALSPVRCAFSPPWSQPQFPPAPVGCLLLLPSASPAPVTASAGRVCVPCV